MSLSSSPYTGKRDRPVERMVSSTSSRVASTEMDSTSAAWVITSLTVWSEKSNTLCSSSFSSSLIEPLSLPRSIIMRISSSVTCSSSTSVLMRSRRSTPLVDRDSSFTTGLAMVAMAETTRQDSRAISIDFCIAIRLGTSSPNTRVK